MNLLTILLVAIILIGIIFGLYLVVTGFHLGHEPEFLMKKHGYPESELIDINGQQVHIRDTGDKSKPALVMLHGVSSSLHTWEVFQDTLSNNYRVISVDSPGFGITGPFPSGEYTSQTYMAFIDGVLANRGVEKATFIGNSFGGYLSCHYALHQPDKVDKLVLIGSAGIRPTLGRSLSEINLGFLLSSMPVSRQLSYFVTPNLLFAASVHHVYGDKKKVTPELVQRYRDLMLRKGNRKAFPEVLELISTDRSLVEGVKNIQKPTLLLFGELDSVHTTEEGKLFNEKMPNSELIIYPGLGHVPMEEGPQALLADVEPFLLADES